MFNKGETNIKNNSLLTLILLTWRIWWAPNNASKWRMGFNGVSKGLILCILRVVDNELTCINHGIWITLILLTWRIWWAPNNASKWRIGFNGVPKGLILCILRAVDNELTCINHGIWITLILLTWRIWWAPNNASKWHMGFNGVSKGLISIVIS